MDTSKSKKRCYPTGLEISFNDEQLNSVVEHWPRFITLEAKLSDQNSKPLTKVSPFLIQKGIQGIIGTPKSVKKLKSGALLIEVTKKQHSTLLALKMLADIPVLGKVHSGLNQSKGILFDRDHDLDGIPEQEIQSELESQGVISVRRFTKKRNDVVEPTNTYLLTFCMPTLPTNIKVGLYLMKIETFVPNPLRCFKCQRFGHGQMNCKGSETCFRCGEEGHDGKTCQNDPKCKNCKGEHMSSSKQCPIWKKEKEIQKVKTEKRIPYPEAKKLVNMYSVPKPNMTYATVVKSSSLKEVSTQVSEKDFLQQTSSSEAPLPSHDKGKSTSSPASAGHAAVAAPKTAAAAASKPESAGTSRSSGRQNRSPPKNNQKQSRDRLPKGADDLVALHNKFGVLEEMDVTPCHSSSQAGSVSPNKNKGRISPISYNKK
ncbi:uncharacterized protein LOC133179670 [Saccostrea echinata]|uniref:uncharacterized protein LOC133179670 n=1 Tax=Saccostrea echinata TaxID=191078 RepID=UPI002A7FC205|nr:uncharacterized protein LOC133179670 [Saccostrea echinata]